MLIGTAHIELVPNIVCFLGMKIASNFSQQVKFLVIVT